VIVAALPRSERAEWMDRADNATEAVETALRDLRMINRWFGGADTLCAAVRPYLQLAAPAATMRVLDVGTGCADLPLALVADARRRGHRVRVTAIDRDEAAVRVARRRTNGVAAIDVVRADVLQLPFRADAFDLVTASLFLHHFRPADVAVVLRRLLALAGTAVVVNDLRRDRLHWLLVHGVGLVTRRGPMFRHDGPLSVLRGFTDRELLDAARSAGARSSAVRRFWPFRLVLTAEP